MESESDLRLRSLKQNSTVTVSNQVKSLPYKTKSSRVFQTVNSSHSLNQSQTISKQRSNSTNPSLIFRTISSTKNSHSTATDKRLGSRFLSTNNNLQNLDSTSPWAINDIPMDFQEFVELFKTFYFRCRRDLKDLFDKFASEVNIEPDYTIKEQYKNDLFDVPRHLSGLITRNMTNNVTNASINRFYDMIAISSIPCYAISTHTRPNYLITKDQFRDFLLEHQKEDKTASEIEQIIYVSN